jgi:predicted dehydrogenase
MRTLWLIGAGSMAKDYAKVLGALGRDFLTIGRGDDSAAAFEADVGTPVRRGGLERALLDLPPPDTAIVALSVGQLAEAAGSLSRSGCRRILLEKPGALDVASLDALRRVADKQRTEIFIGYNRRFYASVDKARELAVEDGGITSAHFEFTEWAHKIAPLQTDSAVKERWLIANSSHVIDLAFHLCGKPSSWANWSSGSIDWHPASARFCGAGTTSNGVLFSYFADWQAPGRWGVELLTRRRRLLLRPLESLQCVTLGTVEATLVDLPDDLDTRFKPGLYRQTEAFLRGDTVRLCTLDEQAANLALYAAMARYD